MLVGEVIIEVSGLVLVRIPAEDEVWEFEIVNPKGDWAVGKGSAFDETILRRDS